MIIINIVIITSLYTLLFFDIKKNSKFFNKPNLFFLNRFIIISILALLLLNFKFSFNFSNQVKDKISIFIDNSLSMNEQIKNNNQIIVKLIDFQNILDQKKIFYDIYSFDSDVNSIQDLEQIKFSENQTNFKNLLTYIKKIETKNNIIVSDGINTGSVIDNKLKDLKEMKVFSLGIGEDLFFEDISINDSYFVNLDFLSDSIMLVVDFNYSLNNNINKKIEFVFNDSSKSKYEKINLYSGTEIYGSKEFTLDKDDAKNLRYIKIDPVEFEKNISNNIFHIKYNSLFDFKNVLLISGQLNNNTSYIKKLINLFDIEILSHQYKIKSKWNKQYNLSNYDLIVFDNYPFSEEDIIDFKQYENLNTELVLFLGINPRTEINKFISVLSNLEYKIEENKNKFILLDNADTDKFLPPIKTGINWYADDSEDCLLFYSDKSCVISKKNNSVYIFMNNLQSYSLQLQTDDLSDIFNDLLLRSLFLGLNEKPLLVKTKFKKTNFDLNEHIDVQFFPNLKNDLKLVFEVLNSSDSLVFIKEIDNFIEREKIQFNITNSGEYNCVTKLLDGENILFKQDEQIRVSVLNVEEKNLFLNEQYLQNISSTTNAKYFHLNELNDLISNFDGSESTKTFKYTLSYLSINKFLWLLIILVSLDWYLRTRKGIL